MDFAKAMKEYCLGERVARSLLLRPAFVRRLNAGRVRGARVDIIAPRRALLRHGMSIIAI